MRSVYFIHDNYNSPFKIVFDNTHKKCSVYKQLDDTDTYVTEPSFVFWYIQAYIGKSPRNQCTEYSDSYGPQFDGNTILLRTNDCTHVYIGRSIIYKFQSDRIVTFLSPIGNNDVPYPYAITENNEIHLLEEMVTMQPRDDIDLSDPYKFYYTANSITKHRRPPVVPKFMGIREWIFGDEELRLTYHPDPEEYWDWLVDIEPNRKNYFMIEGSLREIDKDYFVKVNNLYGELVGFNKLKNIKIVIRLE